METSLCFCVTKFWDGWWPKGPASLLFKYPLWYWATGQRGENLTKSWAKDKSQGIPSRNTKAVVALCVVVGRSAEAAGGRRKAPAATYRQGCCDAIVASSHWDKLGWVTASDFLWWGRKENKLWWSPGQWMEKHLEAVESRVKTVKPSNQRSSYVPLHDGRFKVFEKLIKGARVAVRTHVLFLPV